MCYAFVSAADTSAGALLTCRAIGWRRGHGASTGEAKMQLLSRSFTSLVCLTLVLTACSAKVAPLSEQQVVDIVWQALEPNTSSHNQAAWEIVGVQAVTGREVQALFDLHSALL
jgi:phosphoribosyl-dephospho-CoA transferase